MNVQYGFDLLYGCAVWFGSVEYMCSLVWICCTDVQFGLDLLHGCAVWFGFVA